MAEVIFFDTPDMEVSRNMSAARDKLVLTSGLLNRWCEKMEGGATKIITNTICYCSRYRCCRGG